MQAQINFQSVIEVFHGATFCWVIHRSSWKHESRCNKTLLSNIIHSILQHALSGG